MQSKITVLAVAFIAVAATLGASAYTTGSVSRSANIDVVSDDVGLIGLSDGTSGDIVTQTAGGELSIDFAVGTASGVNPNAQYEVGDIANSNTTMAFNVSNLDSEAHSLTIDYTADDTTVNDGTANVKFRVFDSAGTDLGTASEESPLTVNSVAAGSTLNVVIVVDTTGLTNSTSLSGTLEVSA